MADTKRAMTNLRWVVLRCGAGAEEFATLAQQEMVGHAGDVVTDDAVARRLAGLFGILSRHALGMLDEESKKLIKGGDGAVAILGDGGFGIEMGKEEAF